jgi:hypothetical protein
MTYLKLKREEVFVGVEGLVCLDGELFVPSARLLRPLERFTPFGQPMVFAEAQKVR